MDRLLRELLDLSRVGRVTHPPEDVTLQSLAEEAQQSVAGRLTAAHAQFVVEPELPVLYGDRARLQEVVRNLVDNAAKFMGAQPQPRIVVGARPGPRGPVWFVQDNGIGIDPKHHQRVFGLFERLDTAVEAPASASCCQADRRGARRPGVGGVRRQGPGHHRLRQPAAAPGRARRAPLPLTIDGTPLRPLPVMALEPGIFSQSPPSHGRGWSDRIA